MFDRMLVGVAAALVASLTTFAAEDSDVQLKGYYKNLLVNSRTAFPREEDFALDLNRLRLELRGRPREWFGYEIQYDNEALLGNYLQTAQFAQLKGARPATYWDLEDDYVDRGSLFVRQRLHRGFVSLNTSVADVYLGRQRIAWGSGRFWNPTDLLNPYNPTQLERNERTGVDSVLVERNLGALSRLSLAYAPQRDASDSKALRYRTNVANTDIALMAGKFRGNRVVGFDFAGRIGEASLNGEVARTQPDAGPSFSRAVLGSEYAFVNTLTIGAELYWNGEGVAERTHYDFARLFAGQIQNVARRYVGVHLKYDITPLWRTDNHLIVNLDDHSHFFAPSVVYSLETNWDLAVGMQIFGGDAGGEYSRFHNVIYAALQSFF